MSTPVSPVRPAEPIRAEQELRERLRFETFLADLALRFQRLPADRLDAAIGESLRGLVETLDVDRSSLLELSEDGASHRITHGYARPGVQPPEYGLDMANALPWYTEQVHRGRMLVLPRLPEGLPEEAQAERAYVASAGMKSHVVLPLLVDREIVGSLAIAAFHRQREFPAGFLARLELVASTFAGALYRKRAESRLQEAQDLNRAVLGSITSAIAVLDREGRVAAVNEAWAAEATRVDCPAARVTKGEDYLEACRAGMADSCCRGELGAGVQAVLSGQAARHEMTLRCRRAGGDGAFLVTVNTLLAEAGGAVVTWTDVTEMEQAKAALEESLRQVRELKDRLEAENVVLQQEIRRSGEFEEIVGRSPALAVVLHQVSQVAETDAPVLVLGETGTGKDLVARAIHDRSRRRHRPLVTVNCAALPAALIESELFGYERGAFTGALARTPGRFEVADGGTILLDEVGELPLEVQAKLLRVLQSGEFERLGSSRTLRADVRLIAATNRDLEREVREGRFRADLFYRLGVFPLTLPPLRNRPEDIPLLVWHAIARKQTRLGRHIERVPERLMRAFRAYGWPGNIRELENVVERALILSTGPTLAIDPMFAGARRSFPQPAGGLLSDVERRHILDVLEQCAWRVAGHGNAAERLGLNRSTLLSRMKKLGIRRPAREGDQGTVLGVR
jgi:transcriptional regulator with GAF, ATPase, and Fis domain